MLNLICNFILKFSFCQNHLQEMQARNLEPFIRRLSFKSTPVTGGVLLFAIDECTKEREWDKQLLLWK
jgi:hypothetical protein